MRSNKPFKTSNNSPEQHIPTIKVQQNYFEQFTMLKNKSEMVG